MASTQPPLPLSYASSNTSVIAVTNGKLDPKGAGTATITLSQAGDSHFSAATNATFALTITDNRSQAITFSPIPDCNTSVSSVSLSATASSGLTVSFTVQYQCGNHQWHNRPLSVQEQLP